MLLAVLSAAVAAAASLVTSGEKTVASYCSPSGDVCYGVFNRGGLPVFRQGGSTWGSTVNYARQYPVTLPGRYRVTWKLSSGPLGPSLDPA